jgi:hypothetical protein
MKKLSKVVASLALLGALLISGGSTLAAATGCGDPCVCCNGTCHCPCCQK